MTSTLRGEGASKIQRLYDLVICQRIHKKIADVIKVWLLGDPVCTTHQDNSILLYQVVPSASKIEAEILREFELNLDHPGGNEEGIQDENHQESESRPSGGKC